MPKPTNSRPITGGITPGLTESRDRVTISVPPGAKIRLMAEAANRGMSVSDLLRESLAAMLDWPEIREQPERGRPRFNEAGKRVVRTRRKNIPIPESIGVPLRRRVRGL